ncbi:MAG: pentapeptide repeat-containing protein [Opitutales bacterium]|nr:pentapeptide repeat-containing protein [Opitutales bacterium]
MKTKLSLLTLFACAAGTTLLADNENYDGENLSGRDFSYDSLKNSSWVRANLTSADLSDATLTGADFTGANLTSADLRYATLTGADFTGANLTSANLRYAPLTDADFTDSVIVGANFSSSGLTLSQLYSTKSYKDKNLSGVGLNSFGLSGGSFSGFNLTSADLRYATLTGAGFTGANLTSADLRYATLTDADFTGADLTSAKFTGASLTSADFTDSVIVGANFSSSGLTLSQLYSTKSYKDKNLSGVGLNSFDLSGESFSGFNLTSADLYDATLTGAGFTGANLTSADLRYATLTDADFTDSVIVGADFFSSGLTLSQLYSTKSYRDKDLSGVNFGSLDLSGANFKKQYLTGSSWEHATLTKADFRGSTGLPLTWNTTTQAFSKTVYGSNVILADGTIGAFDVSAGTTFRIMGDEVSAKLRDQRIASGMLVLEEGATLDVCADATLHFEKGEAHFMASGASNGLIFVKSGGNVKVSQNARIVVNFSGAFTENLSLAVMRWETGAIISGFDLAIKEGTLEQLVNAHVSLMVNGVSYDKNLWDFSTAGNALTFTVKPSASTGTITVTTGTQSVSLNGAGSSGSFLPTLSEFSGSVSGNGSLHSTGMLTFSGDTSAFTGTTYVDSGMFTISEKANDGSGVYNVSGKLSVASGAALKLFAGEETSAISVAESGSVTLASGAKIVIDYAGRFNENTRFAVMNWTDSSSIVGLNSLTKGGTLSLFVDGAVYDDTLWDFSTENNALTIFGVATSVDPDPDLPDPDEPIIPDPDVPVIPEEPARVVISSASQSVDLTEADSVADFDGSLTVFSGTISGAGSLNSAGTLTFSGDASTHTGTTNITSGTFTVSGSAKLGTGDFDISGSLAISGSRTFSNATRGTGTLRIASGTTTVSNDVGVKTFAVSQGASATLSAGVDLTRADAEAQVAGTLNLLGTRTFSAKTSGNGKISLASGSDVSFAKAVGVKTLAVENGATLRGSVSMTHGEDAKISLEGTLVLNPDKGEKVSLGGGRVEIASSAKLDLVGSNSLFVRATSAQIEALENGERVTIFEGGSVSGNVLAFLRTDADLSAYAQNYAVIYDESNGGLSVRVVRNASALMDGTDTSELSASFVDWALSDANDALNSLSTGFVSAAAWNNLSGGNDPLLNAILAKDAGTARAILDRLSPKSYAAMIAMPVEAFNADARSISARLEQRRYDRFSKRAQWEFFAQLQTNSVENDTATDAPTFDFDTTGLLAGADYKLDQNTVLGVALGASTGEAKVHNGGGKIESTDFRITGFAGKTIENYFVNAGAQLGYASYDIKRNTDYGNASGDTTGWSAGLFADAGTVVTLSEAKKIYATPYIGLAYMHTQADAFTESGSDKAFDADAISGDSLRARVGCGFSWGFTALGAIWRLGLDVAFSHDFLGDEVDVDVTTQDGSSITETAKALPEDMFSIGPSFNVDVSSSASVYGGYSFNAGTDASVNHSANVGFRMRF